jgi:hypothetical protein
MSKYTAYYYFGFTVDCEEHDGSDIDADMIAAAIYRQHRDANKAGELTLKVEQEYVEDNTCDKCHGAGELTDYSGQDQPNYMTCGKCGGDGEIRPDPDPDQRDR